MYHNNTDAIMGGRDKNFKVDALEPRYPKTKFQIIKYF